MASAHHARIAALAALAGGLLATPLTASADIISVYAAGKADYVDGTGDVYERFEGDISFGALLGMELLGIDFWGEALLMGQDQYMFTGNLGFDLSFGDSVRFNVGVDTGPLIFHFPEQDVPALQIPEALREQFAEIAQQVEDDYAKYSELEREASQWALGWNLARARLSLEFALVPKILYLGAGGHVGYHYMINGEEAAADAKAIIIDRLENEHDKEGKYGFAFDELRRQAGAQEIDRNNLQGINYNVGAFLKVEI